MLWEFQVNSEGTQPYRYMYALSPKLPSRPGCRTTWSRAPCAVEQVLFGYPFKIQQCIHVDFKLTNCLFLPIFPSWPLNSVLFQRQGCDWYKNLWEGRFSLSGRTFKQQSHPVIEWLGLRSSNQSVQEWHGNPLQCFCLKNPMLRGVWQATVYRISQSWT